MHRPPIPARQRTSVEGSGTGSASGTPASVVKARNSGVVNPLLAKTEPTPPAVYLRIDGDPEPLFAALATYRLPALSNASPTGLNKLLLANTDPTPPGVN